MSGTVDRHRRARAIFESLHELTPDTRAAAVATACGDDSALHREVLDLLEAAERMGSFLQNGVARIVAPDARPGDRIGPYEVTGLLASGGMGDVYRARDTTLGRDVALKLLPDVFLADPGRVARFRREARILASLNHPHIATIYSLEDMNGVGALVLELIPGPTLADRLAAGPLPLDQSLQIARQIVDALDAAHQAGIVHRDLKPANIKLREDGIVKVLDFGLAKAIEPPRAPSDAAKPSPPDATHMGVVLGTAAYMSPEQATGDEVDERTDIWAFGCVLFEMLTNRRPFEMATGGDAPVGVRDTPDLNGLPPALRRLLRRCLEPDRARRLADIADARFDLAEAANPDAGVAETPRATGRGPAAAWWLAAASLVAAVWFAVAPPFGGPQRDARVVRSSILLPGSVSLAGALAVSPDGRSLAFTAEAADGRMQLWVRPLDSSVALPVAGTVNAVTPFWSPDGQWIAFVQNQQLRKVAVGGGEPVTLCDRAFAGGAWNERDVILFTDDDLQPRRSLGLGRDPVAPDADRPSGRGDAARLADLPSRRATLSLRPALPQERTAGVPARARRDCRDAPAHRGDDGTGRRRVPLVRSRQDVDGTGLRWGAQPAHRIPDRGLRRRPRRRARSHRPGHTPL